MTTMNVSIPEPMRKWVQAQIDTGRYAGNSDYVRDLIRKDQERHQKIQAMQEAITKGLESGEAKNFDVESFKSRMMNSLNEANL